MPRPKLKPPKGKKAEYAIDEAAGLLEEAWMHIRPSDMIDDGEEVEDLRARMEEFVRRHKGKKARI